MNNKYISDFTLDLYSLDALSPSKRKILEKVFASDNELFLRYKAREKSKQELFVRYNAKNQEDINLPQNNNKTNLIKPRKYFRYYIAVAAVILVTFTFIFSFSYFKNKSIGSNNDFFITQEDETSKDFLPDKFSSITEGNNIATDNVEKVTVLPDTNQTSTTKNDQNKNPEKIALNGLTNEIIPSSLYDEIKDTSYDPWQYHNPWQIINNQRCFVIPNDVEYIYDNQFYDNEIENVFIPSSVRVIKEKAFENNPLLSITIGENVTVSSNAFPYDFASVYIRYNKTNGTYIRSNISSNDWVKQ